MLCDIKSLYGDERNANRMPPELYEKLRENVRRTGKYPPIIVRPRREHAGQYIIIDGHHRTRVLGELGYQQVEIEVWDISDEEATIALATLNRLHGEDDPDRRRDILSQLRESFDVSDMAKMVPESASDIERILRGDGPEEEKPKKKEKPTRIEMTAQQYVTIANAISHLRKENNISVDEATDGRCLELICADWLS